MIIAIEFDELRAGDLARHIAAGLDTHGAVAPAVQYQRGHGNPWQQVPDIGVAKRLKHRRNAAGTGGRAQQSGPSGFRLRITAKARREGFDAGGATPIRSSLPQTMWQGIRCQSARSAKVKCSAA